MRRLTDGFRGKSAGYTLSKWLPAPTAIMWLQMQADYDLWQAEHSGRQMDVEPAHAVPA